MIQILKLKCFINLFFKKSKLKEYELRSECFSKIWFDEKVYTRTEIIASVKGYKLILLVKKFFYLIKFKNLKKQSDK